MTKKIEETTNKPRKPKRKAATTVKSLEVNQAYNVIPITRPAVIDAASSTTVVVKWAEIAINNMDILTENPTKLKKLYLFILSEIAVIPTQIANTNIPTVPIIVNDKNRGLCKNDVLTEGMNVNPIKPHVMNNCTLSTPYTFLINPIFIFSLIFSST